jgi:hypothetical protein
MYIGNDIPSQPILYTKTRVLVLGFNEFFLLFFYPLLNLYLRWKPFWHSLKKISVLITEPFVGIGVYPRFNSNSAPTILTTGPFSNIYGEDVVSPEVAIGGCRTKLSTTKGNPKWIKNNTQRTSYSLPT